MHLPKNLQYRETTFEAAFFINAPFPLLITAAFSFLSLSKLKPPENFVNGIQKPKPPGGLLLGSQWDGASWPRPLRLRLRRHRDGCGGSDDDDGVHHKFVGRPWEEDS